MARFPRQYASVGAFRAAFGRDTIPRKRRDPCSASNCGHPLLHRALRIRQHAALEFRDRCEERTNLAGECRGDTRGAEEGPPGIREAGVYGEELGASKVDDNLVPHAKQYTPLLVDRVELLSFVLTQPLDRI